MTFNLTMATTAPVSMHFNPIDTGSIQTDQGFFFNHLQGRRSSLRNDGGPSFMQKQEDNNCTQNSQIRNVVSDVGCPQQQLSNSVGPQMKRIKLEEHNTQEEYDTNPFFFTNGPAHQSGDHDICDFFLQHQQQRHPRGDFPYMNDQGTISHQENNNMGVLMDNISSVNTQKRKFSLQLVGGGNFPLLAKNNNTTAQMNRIQNFDDIISPQNDQEAFGVVTTISETRQDVVGQQCGSVRFRSHQAENWTEKYEELLDFRLRNGHCLVPNAYPDKSLPEWVKRQRYQYKLKGLGKHSTMSDDRIVALEKIGFVWNSHDAAWEERLKELAMYKSIFGDCNVPSNYSPNPQLAVWVKRQRRQYKFLQQGEVSTMTPIRIEKLLSLGFAWSGRKNQANKPAKNTQVAKSA